MFDKLTGLIPTDNLYKFMALSGSILCATCLLLPLWKITNLARNSQDLAAQKSMLIGEIKYFTERVKKSNKLLQENNNEKNNRNRKKYIYFDELSDFDLATKFKDKNLRDSYEFVYKYKKSFNRYEATGLMNTDSIMKENHRIDMKNIEISNLDDKIRTEKELLDMIVNVSFSGVVLFGIIALTGFYCWYYNNQRVQDEILKKQLNP